VKVNRGRQGTTQTALDFKPANGSFKTKARGQRGADTRPDEGNESRHAAPAVNGQAVLEDTRKHDAK